MLDTLINIDGDWWPAGDTQCRPAVMNTYKDADIAMGLCEKKDVVIQAGGNCGIWPRYLSNHFKTVYTFEPDLLNFLCLNLNAPQENIIRMQAALGMKGEPISMFTTPENVGAHRVGHAGDVPRLRLDDLHLSACDLIQLDVEGYEYFALRGAEKTIKKYRPVIMIEDKAHHLKYGVEKQAFDFFFFGLDYARYDKINRDLIMIPSERS